MIYTEKLNEALKICTTMESVPAIVSETLLELVQKVQEAQIQTQNVGTNTEKRCQCGKASKGY